MNSEGCIYTIIFLYVTMIIKEKKALNLRGMGDTGGVRGMG